jgi:hypothetical protein
MPFHKKKAPVPKGERANLMATLCFSVPGNSGSHLRSQHLEMQIDLKTNPSPLQEILQQRPAIMTKSYTVSALSKNYYSQYWVMQKSNYLK